MQIVLNRIDERLIHGQILATWVKKTSAEKIWIVDDELYKDAFRQSVLFLALPQKVEAKVFSLANAFEVMEKLDYQTSGAAIVLFRSLKTAYELVQQGYPMKELNIGCMAAQPLRKKLNEHIYASVVEREMLQSLIEMGIDVYAQVVAAEPRLSMKALLESSR